MSDKALAIAVELEGALRTAENGAEHHTIYGENEQPDGCAATCPACAATTAIALFGHFLFAIEVERGALKRQPGCCCGGSVL